MSTREEHVHVLLAVDSSDATRKAIDFVGRVLAPHPDARITVLHVAESLPDHYLFSSLRDRLRGLADVWEDVSRDSGHRLLQDVERELVGHGVPADRIETRMVEVDALPESRHVSASTGILTAVADGDYDVVCLGRRGTSPAEGSFVGSVAQHVLREARGTTVWVVD